MTTSTFGLDLEGRILEEIMAHAEREYPREACGLVLGTRGGGALARVAPLANVQDRYHERDPKNFPRTTKDAFRIDELEHMRVVEEADRQGLVERVLYHSHCDAGAYFSPEDRAMAVRDGAEIMPGVVHLVVSVRKGRCADAAAFRYDPTRGDFEETRMPMEGHVVERANSLPDLELRAMEGNEAGRPIRPVGGRLVPRVLGREEACELSKLAEGRRMVLSQPSWLQDLDFMAGGFYSPVSGFLRSADIRSVESRGRLQSGTAWRHSVVLEVKPKQIPEGTLPGTIVELVDDKGTPRGLLAVAEIVERKALLGLGGPVYVYPWPGRPHAAEQRALLLRRGAKRILALPRFSEVAFAHKDLSSFDAVLRCNPTSDQDLVLYAHEDPWLTAAMAQNQGATHIAVAEDALRARILDTLDIEPWR